MRILFLIILNSVLLFLGVKYLNIYWINTDNLPSITMWCINEVKAFCDIRSYFMLGTLVSIGNLLIVFIFQKLSLPDFFLTKFIWILITTCLIFVFFSKLMSFLQVSMLSYNINWITNFIIIVAIFDF